MSFEGTVINGQIVLDGGVMLPEGCRVRVLEPEDDEWDDFAPPPSKETREEFLESLRQSIEESKAGIGGVDARQFLKDL